MTDNNNDKDFLLADGVTSGMSIPEALIPEISEGVKGAMWLQQQLQIEAYWKHRELIFKNYK